CARGNCATVNILPIIDRLAVDCVRSVDSMSVPVFR
ncbi:unnamed protein product, partial [marine sediment metagenome]